MPREIVIELGIYHFSRFSIMLKLLSKGGKCPYAISRMRGSTGRQRVPYSVFRKELDIPLPPKPEQRKIASVLYTVDQAIQKTEENIKQTKRVKKGLMWDIYTSGLNGENVEETAFGPLPESWKLKKIDQICSIRGGSTPNKDTDEFWNDGDILWSSPKDFNGPELIETEDKITEIGAQESNLEIFDEGTVLLVTRSGVLAHTLPVAKVVSPTTVNQDVKALKPNSEEIDTEFFFQVMSLNSNNIRLRCYKRGTTVQNLDTTALKKFGLKIPPLAEQLKIAEIGNDFDKEIKLSQKKLDKLKRLKKGLMQDLLSGEVRTNDKHIKILDEVLEHG